MTRFIRQSGAPVGDADRSTRQASGCGYLNPAASPRLLVVLAQFAVCQSVEVIRQNAPATAPERVARVLLRLTSQVRMNFAAHEDAQVVLMPAATADLRSDPMLTTLVRGPYGVHFFLLP